MAKTLYLEIITPEKQFFTGNVEGIVLPALDGQYGVQPGHEPIVTALEPGNVRYCVDGAWKEIVVTQGFAEIMPDYAIMLVSTAERPMKLTAHVQNVQSSVQKSVCASSRAFRSIITPRQHWRVRWHV